MDAILEIINNIPRGIRWQLNSRLEDLDYADDLCLLSRTHKHIQQKLDLLNAESNNAGLKIISA